MITDIDIMRARTKLVTEREINDLAANINRLTSDPEVVAKVLEIQTDIVFYNRRFLDLKAEPRDALLEKIHKDIIFLIDKAFDPRQRTALLNILRSFQ